ncbi:MAG TPA: glycosyltransferase family 9 protein [Candidatus Acidoferrales bacterium]|nr:glycosyltransferase family 9 protein [Candidatus Acidoferrales bacterium]
MSPVEKLFVNTDCRHYRGHIPCKPHKLYGVHCAGCDYYDPVRERLLIIKLGALGDVIRTTPLLRKIKSLHPQAEIWWITHAPEFLPDEVDRKLKFEASSLLQIEETEFDFLFSLDKDYEAAALANRVKARVKRGFVLHDGKTYPADDFSYPKYLTGLFDDVNKANTKTYLEEIFELCGLTFGGEKYLLSNFNTEGYKWDLSLPRPVIGLNTGCGGRWTSRLWSEDNWSRVAKTLKSKGYGVLLLGGEQEDARNKSIAAKSGAKYFGYHPLRRFINLVDQVDLVVTGVTMGMHIAIGLSKKIVLINNIFNKHEFELYGLGKIVEPDRECKCFFQPTCVNKDYFCLDHLPCEKVIDAVAEVLKL